MAECFDCNDLGDYIVIRLRSCGISVSPDAEPRDILEALKQVRFLPSDKFPVAFRRPHGEQHT